MSSLSASLQDLISTGDLAQMLGSGSSTIVGSSVGSVPGRRSRSWIGHSTGSHTNLLGQYGLSRSEVERWMGQHAPNRADMRSHQQGQYVSSYENDNASGSSVGSNATWMRNALPGATPTALRRSPSPRTRQLTQAAACHHPQAVTMHENDLRLQCKPHVAEIQATDGSRQQLETFESQVRWVADQARALREESVRLRTNGSVDPDQLDALLRMLPPLASGDEVQPQAPTKVNRRRNHRQDQLDVLRRWFDEHGSDPYPSPEEKTALAERVGMEVRQIEHWFTNRRKRHWRSKAGQLPMHEHRTEDPQFEGMDADNPVGPSHT